MKKVTDNGKNREKGNKNGTSIQLYKMNGVMIVNKKVFSEQTQSD